MIAPPQPSASARIQERKTMANNRKGSSNRTGRASLSTLEKLLTAPPKIVDVRAYRNTPSGSTIKLAMIRQRAGAIFVYDKEGSLQRYSRFDDYFAAKTEFERGLQSVFAE